LTEPGPSDARPGADALVAEAVALQDAGEHARAVERYQQALALDARHRPALQNLGFLLITLGATDEGAACLARAQAIAPSDLNRLLLATVLPAVHPSSEDATLRHRSLLSAVHALAQEGVTIDTERTVVPSPFLAAYDGSDDRELYADMGRILRGPDLTSARVRHPPAADSGSRIRVGFISAHFHEHTIGRLNLGRVQRLDRERFEVVVLSASGSDDAMAAAFEQAADGYVRLPRDPAAARQLVAGQNLDLLFFTDVGMDALTYTLAFSRMAPVQCAGWGHPVTTGSPMIDYFVSSELLEGQGAERHYTERLVRLPTLGNWYARPPELTVRIELGLGPAHLYACPQTLFKLHPHFDPLLAEILRRDPNGVLLLIEGPALWTSAVRERIGRVMPDVADRVRWLPPLPREQFLGLLGAVDVVLDPVTFGGGNTSYEALAMGTPVVTLPGEMMRTRITTALYTRAGYTELVASSADEYVSLAVTLATDPDRRAAARAKIDRSCRVLFENDAEIRDLEQFLQAAVQPGPSRLRV
jgi:protein O-GlcNAc transferase